MWDGGHVPQMGILNIENKKMNQWIGDRVCQDKIHHDVPKLWQLK
jgi:hypothetical protein